MEEHVKAQLEQLENAWRGSSFEKRRLQPLATHLRRLLEHGASDERSLAAAALPAILGAPLEGEKVAQALGPLIAAELDSRDAGRIEAGLALLKLFRNWSSSGFDAAALAPSLVEIVGRSEAPLVAGALAALSLLKLDAVLVTAAAPRLHQLASHKDESVRHAAARFLVADALARQDRAVLEQLLVDPGTSPVAIGIIHAASEQRADISAAAGGLAKLFLRERSYDAGYALRIAARQGGDISASVHALLQTPEDAEYPRSPDADMIEQSDLRGERPIAEAAVAVTWHYLHHRDLAGVEALVKRGGSWRDLALVTVTSARKMPEHASLHAELDRILSSAN